MIKTILSSELPVDEHLLIRKQTLKNGSGKKRACIVTGTHGDELEGQYVCYKLARLLTENQDLLDGTVDIYPALNPMGIDSITRGIPNFDLDMNRIFPGDPRGSMAETMAYTIMEDLRGADLVIDIHASNIYLKEVPQVRINCLTVDTLLPLAMKLGMDFIWIHEAATVLESTLAYSLNSVGTPTLVVEMGVGMRITQEYGDRLADGILNLLHDMGIWKGDPPAIDTKSTISTSGEVDFFNAVATGIFLPHISHSMYAQAGQIIGEIVEPLTGHVLETIRTKHAGFVFTIRAYPVVYEGSLVARVFRTNADATKEGQE